MGWEHAIRGMRNPMNSWAKSDSGICGHIDCNNCTMDGNEEYCYDFETDRDFVVGKADHELMMKLAKGGPVHAKYRRMIAVYMDITAPLYWWKEFDTYKVGTVANSCSTMHKIHEKEFGIDDFSCEQLLPGAKETLYHMVARLNFWRSQYIETKDKKYWWQMIQLLPNSYNQKRTIMLNYEVLAGMYESRKNHKLDEWREFCKWIEGLPYSEIITGGSETVEIFADGKLIRKDEVTE